MYILGIDPGSQKIGYACLRMEGGKLSYVRSGIKEFKQKIFLLRLELIAKFAQELYNEFSFVDEIALESLIFVKNPDSLIKLSQARGVLLASFLLHFSGRIFEYSPNVVKGATTGHGHASKLDIQKLLSLYIGKKDYLSYDESDAVAVAICHSFHKRNINQKVQFSS